MNGNVSVLIGSLNEYESGNATPVELIQDLENLLLFSPDDLKALALDLQQLDSSDIDEIVSTVRNHFSDENKIRFIVNLINSFASSGEETAKERFIEMRADLKPIQEKFNDQQWAIIEKNALYLCGPFSCVRRFQKHVQLQAIIGNNLQQVDIVCDLRPMFDDTREHFEGFIPITTLKFIYNEQNGNTKSLELVASDEMLEQINVKLEQLKRKREILSNFE